METLIKMKNQSAIILAVVALAVGLGGGYYYSLSMIPAPVTPGPVDNLDRPNPIPYVHGWYKGADITYFDFGSSPTIAAPILAFFESSNPETAIDGQMNIIDAIPGQPSYSDFWRVYKILAPSSYTPNSITSFEEAVASGYEIVPTDIVVNCPVVNPGTTTEEKSNSLVQGWYRGREVYYFDFGTNTGATMSVLEYAPIYAFFRANGDPVEGQRNIIDVVIGEPGYSDLWHVIAVTVEDAYVANTLKSAGDIIDAVASGSVTIHNTDIYVNCPLA